MIIECTIDCLDEKIDSLFENLYVDSFEVSRDEDCLILADSFKVSLPSMGIYMRSGIVCNYSEEDEDYLPDFSITLIYKDDSEEYEYWEQDPFVIALHNYRNIIKDESFDGKCVIEIDDDCYLLL